MIQLIYVSVDAISPLPSIGTPNALTTRPKYPSPTGTCAIFPVAFTAPTF